MVRILISILVLILSSAAWATPMLTGTDSDGNVSNITWPSGTVLNVFIDKETKEIEDPEGGDDIDRAEKIKEGIERWQGHMADRGITINVTVGKPPKGTKNVIKVGFKKDGTKVGGLTLGDENKAIGTCTTDSQNTKLAGGSITFSDDQFCDFPSGSHVDEFVNIAEHEFCHVLGLADDDAGAVLSHAQDSEDRDLNDHDKKELKNLYPKTTGGGGSGSAPTGTATHISGGALDGFVIYNFDFEPSDPVPDPEEPEHVALITIGIPPSHVLGVTPPPGWLVLLPDGPLSHTDPFFTTDSSMVDGTIVPTVWSPSPPPRFVALRYSTEQALLDGVLPGVDPALGPDTPSFSVELQLAPGLSDCTIRIWAGGEVQEVSGPYTMGPLETLHFNEAGELAWLDAAGAGTYDIIRGNLQQLRGTAGDYATAADTCLANDTPATALADPLEPASGEGLFYLDRPRGCGPHGPYDSRYGQQGTRDPGLAISAGMCP